MHNVLLVVIQRKAAMSEPKHPAVVGIEPGEQGGPAGGTRGRSAEGFAEQNAFLREPLQDGG